MNKLRLDKYLWAIRIFKTRNIAKKVCESGSVKMNGKALNPAHVVALDDIYEIRTSARHWIIKVISLAEKRLPYTQAIQCYEDQTPEEKRQNTEKQIASFYTGKRLSKTGKPTKKQRRSLKDFLGD